MSEKPSRTVKSANNLFGVLEAVHELDGGGATEIADHLGIAKSTAHDHLTTLVKHEFLIKENSNYRVGLKCLNYGIKAKNRLELTKVSKPPLEQMAEETGEITWLMVEEYGRGVYLQKAMGDRAVQPYGEIGKRVPLQNIAAGKAILAHLSDDRVGEIVSEYNEGTEDGPNTAITDLEEFLTELETIRECGYALNDSETFEGFRAVASPIIVDDALFGSIVVSGPENRFRGERFRTELPELVTGTANAIELRLANY